MKHFFIFSSEDVPNRFMFKITDINQRQNLLKWVAMEPLIVINLPTSYIITVGCFDTALILIVCNVNQSQPLLKWVAMEPLIVTVRNYC